MLRRIGARARLPSESDAGFVEYSTVREGSPAVTPSDANATTVASNPPEGVERQKSPNQIGTILGFAYAIVAIASSATAVVVPTISDQFDLSLSTAAWIITAPVIALAASAPVYGRVADHIGPKVPITIGLLVMSLGGLLSAIAPTAATLIAARAVIGFGSGAIPVLGPVIIAASLAEKDRPRALTRMSGLAALAASGLFIGAIVADLLGWRFVVAFPLAGLALITPIRRLAHDSDDPAGLAGIDIAGGLGIALGAVGINLVLQLPTNASVGFAGLALVAVGVAMGVVGAKVSASPFIPLTVLRRSITWRVAAAGASIPATFFSLLIAIPEILTEQNFSRLEIGSLLLPAAAVGVLIGPVAARLRQRFSEPLIATIGLAIAFVALLAAGIFSTEPIALAVAFALIAASFSMGQGSLLGLLTSATPKEEHGAALAVFMVVFFLGGGIGGTLLTVFGNAMSLGQALLIIAVLPALASISALSFSR